MTNRPGNRGEVARAASALPTRNTSVLDTVTMLESASQHAEKRATAVGACEWGLRTTCPKGYSPDCENWLEPMFWGMTVRGWRQNGDADQRGTDSPVLIVGAPTSTSRSSYGTTTRSIPTSALNRLKPRRFRSLRSSPALASRTVRGEPFQAIVNSQVYGGNSPRCSSSSGTTRTTSTSEATEPSAVFQATVDFSEALVNRSIVASFAGLA